MGRFAAEVIVLAIGHALLALVRPADTRAPAGERDRAVELRSTKIAYSVRITGMILVGIAMPFSAGGWKLIVATGSGHASPFGGVAVRGGGATGDQLALNESANSSSSGSSRRIHAPVILTSRCSQ
jgi:hypothetical protein